MNQLLEVGENMAGGGVIRTTPRWLVGAAIFAVGVGVGVLASHLGTSGQPKPPVEEAIAIGCGADVTLIVDAVDLQYGRYELRASVGDRLLPMIDSMTHPVIGEHHGHQSVAPDDGRLLLVANVPVGEGNPLRYELVREDSERALSGVLQPEACTPEG